MILQILNLIGLVIGLIGLVIGIAGWIFDFGGIVQGFGLGVVVTTTFLMFIKDRR